MSDGHDPAERRPSADRPQPVDRPHPVDRHVGRRLRQRRALVGMSQERLGELLGITFQQIQKYERGANRIGSSRLFEIAGILAVPVSYFFEGIDAPAAGMAASGHAGTGLAEESAGFDFDAAAPPPAAEDVVVDSRETLELVRAFQRISDPLVRRRLFELTKVLANLSYVTETNRRHST